MSHAAVAAKAMGQGVEMETVLADQRTVPGSARFHSALEFLEKLTLRPDEISPKDVKTAQAQGINDAALLQAIYVCFIFSTMDRIADAMAFELPDERILKRYAWIANTVGYRWLSLPG